MKILHFVSASSVVLALWLAVTFFYHLPAQRYLKSDHNSPTAAVLPDPSLAHVTPAPSESTDLSFPASP
jgi:hypothetical protein